MDHLFRNQRDDSACKEDAALVGYIEQQMKNIHITLKLELHTALVKILFRFLEDSKALKEREKEGRSAEGAMLAPMPTSTLPPRSTNGVTVRSRGQATPQYTSSFDTPYPTQGRNFEICESPNEARLRMVDSFVSRI